MLACRHGITGTIFALCPQSVILQSGNNKLTVCCIGFTVIWKEKAKKQKHTSPVLVKKLHICNTYWEFSTAGLMEAEAPCSDAFFPPVPLIIIPATHVRMRDVREVSAEQCSFFFFTVIIIL